MLSVLIPTYNYTAFFLVEEIHKQLIFSKITFEIICLDDGSKSDLNSKNEQINNLPFSSFKSLKKNIGRSAIRNLLAQKATYEWLLFLDADVFPKNKDFIARYIQYFSSENSVFCGGILYEDKNENKPLLRYKYGKKYEEITLKQRKTHSEKYFLSPNFFIRKKTFETIRFDESLSKYGYEDLLFSKKIHKKSLKIEQLDNEVYHLGIDSNKVFLEKTQFAIQNLKLLLNRGLLTYNDTGIGKLYKKIKRFGMIILLEINFLYFKKNALKKSSLLYYNLYRLAYLHQIIKNSK